ncbi:MAG: hypothetical protein KDB60_04860 [Propionibacteriaceae bacterium]|nr:hypothetical protein [Propionibacteriaceae bacterium]
MQPDDLAATNGRRSLRDAQASVRIAIIAAVGGLLLGGLNSLSNVLGSPYSPQSLNPGGGVFALEVLAAVLGTPGAWAITAFIAGFLTGKIWSGPLVGVATLLIADLSYYLIDSTSGYAALSTDEVLYWAALAVPTGLVMGLLGALATQPHWWSILPGLAAPATLAALARSTGSGHIQPWPMQVTLAVAAALAVIILTTWSVRIRQRH